MKEVKEVVNYLNSLPEGSKIDFHDENDQPVKVSLYELEEVHPFKTEASKTVIVQFNKEVKPISVVDYKLWYGIQSLALNWKEYREDYFRYACEKSEDDRWKDEGFRKHMYNEYVNTDRPITDRIYNLDVQNLRTLFMFIKEDLTRGIAEVFREI